MKMSNKLQRRLRTAVGVVMLLAVLMTGLEWNTIVSLADSAGKVTVSSAKVRKEPSTTSESVGSVLEGTIVSITGQATGNDGSIWYKVSVDGGIVGYIRSDLMQITDGSTPGTVVTPTTPSSTPTTSTPDEPLVDVAEVEPVSASVSGGSPVRVRQNASTTSRIVTTAQSGLAMTVIGQATGTDNKEWYQVSFISNGSEVSGFIRADYVTVSGDLVPAGSAEVQEPVEVPETKEPEPEEEKKDWETYYDTKWHLVDNTTGNSYDIEQIFSSVEANTQTLQKTLKENKTQQIIIIILVILGILLGTVACFLFFKIKDMADSAYFNEVERETVRRRTADRPATQRPQSGQKVMQTVGAEGAKRPAGQAMQRPAGQSQRPAGQGTQRPASQGQRPASQGQRPASQGQRPAGQRPAGQGAQRPASQASQRAAGQRPAGQGAQRPVGQATQRPTNQGQRPVGQATQRPANQGQRPAGQGVQRPAGQAPVRQRPVQPKEVVEEVVADEFAFQDAAIQEAQPMENETWQAKNFANEGDFEFQFLDWSEEEQQ